MIDQMMIVYDAALETLTALEHRGACPVEVVRVWIGIVPAEEVYGRPGFVLTLENGTSDVHINIRIVQTILIVIVVRARGDLLGRWDVIGIGRAWNPSLRVEIDIARWIRDDILNRYAVLRCDDLMDTVSSGVQIAELTSGGVARDDDLLEVREALDETHQDRIGDGE
jgi:hypothetical protein